MSIVKESVLMYAELQAKHTRLINDAASMWQSISRQLDEFAKLQQEIGAAKEQLNAFVAAQTAEQVQKI